MNNYFNQDYKPELENGQSDVLEVTEVVDVPSLVRSTNSGDKIYFVKNGTKHWVTSPEVLKALGFDFGQEKEIDRTVMANLQSGEPIRMENVNEYILPIEEVKEEPQEAPAQVVEATESAVDNSPKEGYFTVVVFCTLSSLNVPVLTKYISELKTYFSGEIISVVKNECNYKDYSPIFGHKVIECESIEEGVERAIRVARGRVLVADAI